MVMLPGFGPVLDESMSTKRPIMTIIVLAINRLIKYKEQVQFFQLKLQSPPWARLIILNGAHLLPQKATVTAVETIKSVEQVWYFCAKPPALEAF
ncbi:MAG: hypothetical protein ACI808_002492 [Paraglaciecola sp.]|jgi:hypothetical protein